MHKREGRSLDCWANFGGEGEKIYWGRRKGGERERESKHRFLTAHTHPLTRNRKIFQERVGWERDMGGGGEGEKGGKEEREEKKMVEK